EALDRLAETEHLLGAVHAHVAAGHLQADRVRTDVDDADHHGPILAEAEDGAPQRAGAGRRAWRRRRIAVACADRGRSPSAGRTRSSDLKIASISERTCGASAGITSSM